MKVSMSPMLKVNAYITIEFKSGEKVKIKYDEAHELFNLLSRYFNVPNYYYPLPYPWTTTYTNDCTVSSVPDSGIRITCEE